ncbi:FMN-linked oxidoreductase [Xylariomycetidae sp. FL0641]|nr:FMN-linked oxidoreductase [Xylariomycetidae sp. FL0641]
MAEVKVAQADQAPVVTTPVSTEKKLINHGAPNVPFYTPLQDPPAGTAWDAQPKDSLFAPLKINGMTIHNRIIVSPMCLYSGKDGYMTIWHHVHLGSFAVRGAGLILTEVIAVCPEGRLSPQDLGLWEDGQIEPLRQIVDFAHSQGTKLGIQLGHAGRKASTVAPWLDRKAAAQDYVSRSLARIPYGSFATDIDPHQSEGWPDQVVAPTAEAYSPATIKPHEASHADIEKFKADWVAAIRRALKAGVDTIEVHGAHGYLLNEFLSPTANKRTDMYGGSLGNRMRLFLETVELLRAEVPAGFPVLVRMPATDYLEHDPAIPQWDLPQARRWLSFSLPSFLPTYQPTNPSFPPAKPRKGRSRYALPPSANCPCVNLYHLVTLAKALSERGADFLDISGGGTDARQKINPVLGYQVPYAEAVKKELAGSKTLVGTVGEIKSGKQAQEILSAKSADAIIAGRAFLKDPSLVWSWADELGLDIQLPSQYGWAFGNTRTHRPSHKH